MAVTNPENMIEETLDEYTRLINEAAESGADIVAFPEGCLNYVGIATRSLLIKHAVELNDNDLRNSTDFNGGHCDYKKKSPVRIQERFEACRETRDENFRGNFLN